MVGAFAGCDKLTDVYYAGTESEWKKLVGNETTGIPNFTCTIHYESSGPNS